MFGRKRTTEDFGAEIDAHIALEAERLQEEGLSAEDARAAARRRFGNVTRSRERFYESRRWLWWDHLRQDVRFGARMLRKTPGFTAIAVATMALGIGATTAIFSVVDATLLDPLPYSHPEQLVTVVDDLAGAGAHDAGMSQPEWEDLAHSGIFRYVSPAWFDENNLTGSTQPASVRLLIVAPNYFALSLALMAAASLLLRSFRDLLNAPLGFHPENVITLRTRLPYPNDPKADRYATAAQEGPFVREALRRIRTLPGVEEAAVGDTAAIPLDQSLRDLKRISEGQFVFTVEGRETQNGQAAVTDRSSVTPEYFHLLGMQLVRGRLFNEFDTDQAPPVAVVNEAFAQAYWPNENPIGRRFRKAAANSPWIAAVGVIGNAKTGSLAERNVPKIYLNLYQFESHRLAMFVRGHLDAAAISDAVRERVQSVDPTLPVFGAQSLDDVVTASLSVRRFSMEMVGLFALTALLLAGLGNYGVISHVVNERTHEIGIRRALGAQSGHILRMVLQQGMGLAVAGAAAGLVGALIVSHLMAGMLYGVTPSDPLTFASVGLALIGVALVGCYVPARRAAEVDPMSALREG